MKPPSAPNEMKPPRCRSPNGVDSVLRVSVALMPDEREILLKKAAMDGRTTSAMARVYMVRGMQADPDFNTKHLVQS